MGFLLSLILIVFGVLTENITLRKLTPDPSLNGFPMTVSESVADAVSPGGQGVFVISGNDCTVITSPVIGGSWCLSSGPPPGISIYTNTGWQSYIPSNQPADFGFSFIGVPTTSTQIKYVVARTYTFPANLTASGNAASSQCSAGIAATGSSVFNIQHNGSTVATATFAASATTCTFSTQASFALASGDTLAIIAPVSVDATLANISITLGATRN